MPGYGGQDIALDVNTTPLDITSPLQKVQAYETAQNENAYRSALTDAQTQRTSEESQLFPLKLQEAQNTSALNTATTQRQMLSRAMSSIDPSDPNAATQWDASMRKLQAAGVSDAGQYIGKYSPDRQQRLVAAYGADNATSALAGIGMSSTPDAQLSPQQMQEYDVQFGKMNPDQLKQVYGRFEQIKDALNQVANSANPAATWNQLAPQFGHNEPFSWQAFKNAWGQVAPLDTYLRGRMTNQEAGAPAPIVPGQIMRAGDGSLVKVDAAGDVQTLVKAPDKWTTNAAGLTTNARTGEVRDSSGVTSGAAGPVFDQIGTTATSIGASPDEASQLRQLAWVESKGDPTAKSPTGPQGLFQTSAATFNRFGGKDISSVADQTRAGLGAWREAVQLADNVGDGTPQNAYVVYQQGPGGGPALLKAAQSAPDAKAFDVIRPFYKTDADAKQAITANGGTPDMTAADFVQHVQGQWDAGASGVQSATAQGLRFPKGYDEPTFQNLFWEQALSGKEPAFTRGPGGSAGVAQAAYRQWQAKFMQENGFSASDMKNTASMAKAIGSTQAKVAGLQSQVETSERTANDNADLALSLAPQNGNMTNFPALNQVIRAAEKGVGSPGVVKFDAALGTFLDEYAKVMTSNTGTGGVTSDSARATAYERVSKAAADGQLQGAIGVMKQEMANRGHELDAQMQTLQQGMSALTPHASQAAAGVGASAANPHGAGYTQAQQATLQRFEGASAPGGSVSNPKVPVNQAQYDALPAGAHYIAPDGSIKIKGVRQQGA